LKLITVNKSGGVYRPEHTDRLESQCKKFAPGVEFVCLDDSNLLHNWPGWWSKMETFRFLGPVLYLDLSNTIINDLKPLLYIAKKHSFVVTKDFNFPQRLVQSCIMSWAGDMRWLYEKFLKTPSAYIETYKTPDRWGDQGFIEVHANTWKYWQDILPESVCSYKKNKIIPDNCRIINFHGKPKPWEVKN